MSADARSRVTDWVASLAAEPRSAPAPPDLMPLVYDELRRLAGRFMAGERRDHTLDATGLVHEAFLKLVDQSRVEWQGRSHFFAVGAEAMRRLLIDHARGRGRLKRGRDWRRVSLNDALGRRGGALDHATLIDVHRAIERLSTLDRRQARVVELRFFGGMTVDEVAAVLGVSRRTVEGDWTHAKAWLRREIADR